MIRRICIGKMSAMKNLFINPKDVCEHQGLKVINSVDEDPF